MKKDELLPYEKIAIDLDESYPFMICRTVGIYSGSSTFHGHDSLEICYIKQGTGTYFIGGTEYSFQKGDIFIIGSNEIHLAYHDKDVIILVLLFSPNLLWTSAEYSFEVEYLKPFWEVGQNFNKKIDLTSKYYDEIVKLLNDLELENEQKEDYYRLMIKSQLLKLSTLLNRHLNIKDDGHLILRMKSYHRIRPILAYIETSYAKQLKLKDLAALANLSVSHFCLIFKDTMGLSPMEYLIKKRIAKASQILIETDSKIIDIATSCGFVSISNFIESFKKYTGKVPRDFKKSTVSKEQSRLLKSV